VCLRLLRGLEVDGSVAKRICTSAIKNNRNIIARDKGILSWLAGCGLIYKKVCFSLHASTTTKGRGTNARSTSPVSQWPEQLERVELRRVIFYSGGHRMSCAYRKRGRTSILQVVPAGSKIFGDCIMGGRNWRMTTRSQPHVNYFCSHNCQLATAFWNENLGFYLHGSTFSLPLPYRARLCTVEGGVVRHERAGIPVRKFSPQLFGKIVFNVVVIPIVFPLMCVFVFFCLIPIYPKDDES
jgi:hypothetical protein